MEEPSPGAAVVVQYEQAAIRAVCWTLVFANKRASVDDDFSEDKAGTTCPPWSRARRGEAKRVSVVASHKIAKTSVKCQVLSDRRVDGSHKRRSSSDTDSN